MEDTERTANSSWAYGPVGGAAIGVGLAFAYAALFIVYATIRSSLLVIRVNPDAGVPGTVAGYLFTLAIPALVIAAMMAVPAALVGLFTAPILMRVASKFNPRRSAGRAIMIGSTTCLIVALLLLVIFQRMLGFSFADVLANPETFLFWFVLPAVIFVAAGGLAGREINRVSDERFRTLPAGPLGMTSDSRL